MGNIKILLWAVPAKDGRCAVKIRITYKRKVKYFPLGIKALPADWDDDKGRLKRSHTGYKKDNALILSVEARAHEALRQFALDATPFTFSRFFESVFGKPVDNNLKLSTVVASIVAEMEQDGAHANARVYKEMGNLCGIFQRNTALSDIDAAWLKRFENWQRRERGKAPGGISVTMRTLRAVCNRVVKAKQMPRDWYPFIDYSLSHLKSRDNKRAITLEKIKEIEGLELTEQPQIFARDMFLFSFYMRGINLADMARLTSDNVKSGRLEYVRKKTRSKSPKVLSVLIRPKGQEIIDRYAGANPGRLFPIVGAHLSGGSFLDRLKTMSKRINHALKGIASMVGIEGDFTFYVARHTYATSLKQLGFSTSFIKDAIGHDSEKTTDIYLRSFDNDLLDEADRRLD